MSATKKHPLRVWSYLNDLTLTEIASELGVTQGLISLWMHGRRRIPASTALRVEEITGGAVALDDWAWLFLEGEGREVRREGAGRDKPRSSGKPT